MKKIAHIARLGMALGLLAASTASYAKKDEFDLVGSGTGLDRSVSAAGVITGELKGQSTLLGNFNGVVSHTFKNNGKDFEGSGYLRALNGDVLSFKHSGKIDTDQVPLDLKGSFEVTGGTGAFEGASGKAKISGRNFGHGIVEYSFEGKISFEDNHDDDGEDDEDEDDSLRESAAIRR